MNWATIRKATDEDWTRLNAAALRFASRHGARYNAGHPVEDVEMTIASDFYNGPYLHQLWRRCVKRALRSKDAEGIRYGYVGFSVE